VHQRGTSHRLPCHPRFIHLLQFISRNSLLNHLLLLGEVEGFGSAVLKLRAASQEVHLVTLVLSLLSLLDGVVSGIDGVLVRDSSIEVRSALYTANIASQLFATARRRHRFDVTGSNIPKSLEMSVRTRILSRMLMVLVLVLGLVLIFDVLLEGRVRGEGRGARVVFVLVQDLILQQAFTFLHELARVVKDSACRSATVAESDDFVVGPVVFKRSR